MFGTTHQGKRGDVGVKARLPMLVPAFSAPLYFLALKGFHASVTRIADAGPASVALS